MRRLRRYLLWAGSLALLGWVIMNSVWEDQCLSPERINRPPCVKTQPPDPGDGMATEAEAERMGALAGAVIGLIAALAQDEALWKRRRR